MGLLRRVLSAWAVLQLACSSNNEPPSGARDASLRDAEAADIPSACAAYFSAMARCNVYAASFAHELGWEPFRFFDRPKQELERLQVRFEAHCRAWLALPGVGFTADGLAACGTAVATDGCDAVRGSSCTFAGTLAVGEPCVLGEQCASGDCYGTFSCGGSSACGACRAPAGVDEACDDACESRPPCRAGMLCSEDDRCYAPRAPGAEGERCAGGGVPCEAGLYCPDGRTCERLAEPAGLGEPCSRGTPCVEPFVCPPSSDMSGAAICEELVRGRAGEDCTHDGECVEGLGCAPAGICVKRTFAEPGAPCEYELGQGCRVGECVHHGPEVPSTCPRVLAEGERCDPQSVSICDQLAACIDGRCTLALYPTCEAEEDGGRDD